MRNQCVDVAQHFRRNAQVMIWRYINGVLSVKIIMAFLNSSGYSARIFYLNVLFAVMVFLSSFFTGTLGATYGDGENAAARYEVCSLTGAGPNSTCPMVGDDTTGKTLYDIGVAIAVINALIFLWSCVAHWNYGADLLTKAQILISLLNIGLFSGLVGNLNSVEGILLEPNVENNVFFSGANPYMVAVFGLAFGVADIVMFSALNMFYFKGRCDYGTDPEK